MDVDYRSNLTLWQKVRENLLLAKAKFIGAEGGSQNRVFDDALALASRIIFGTITVVILDGIIWIPNSGQMSKKLDKFSGSRLSALLLDDFLSSV